MTSAAKAYSLVRPCPACPFRTDVDGYLRRGRASEIAASIAEGGEFACHQTTVPSEEGDDMEVGPDSKVCAGSLIVMEHEEIPNQAARFAERLGFYDASRLDMDAPVHRSFAAFVMHHGSAEVNDDEDAVECCSVCDPGCEAPAGFLINGIAVPSEDPEVEVGHCPECGEPVCDSCSDDDGFCRYCHPDDEED